jgi:hypothetical protein
MNTVDPKRTTLCATFLFLILFSTIIVQVPRVLAAGSILITPSAIDDQSILPGSTFKINSSASTVADVFTWQIQIDFDPNILQCVSASVPSTSIFRMDFTPDAIIDNVTGTVVLGSSRLMGLGVSGSDVLAILNFSVVKRGYSRLNYSRPLGNGTYLLDSLQRDISLTIQDSHFDNHIPGLQNWLTIQNAGSGITNPPSGTYLYIADQNASVNAFSFTGWRLDHWELDSSNVGCINPLAVAMSSDHILIAVFNRISYNLTIQIVGSGSTDPIPGNYTYNEGTFIQVHALPASGWLFDHWEFDSVNVGSNDPYVGFMDSNHVLKVVMTKIPCTQYQLSVDVAGVGGTSPLPGNWSYDEGSLVPVKAVGNVDWVFDHWIFDGSSTVYLNPCEIVMDTNHSLLAVFVEASSTPDNAILNLVSKSVVGRGFSTNITFTVRNQGAYTATWRSRLNVTLYYNQTVLTFADGQDYLSLELGRGESATLMVTWIVNASEVSLGNYVLSVHLSPVAFETDLDDNIVEYRCVCVTVAGNVIGPFHGSGCPDDVVNMRDIGAIANAFGTSASSSSWNPNMDIDNDGTVTLFDLGQACQNFGGLVEIG